MQTAMERMTMLSLILLAARAPAATETFHAAARGFGYDLVP